MTPAEWIAVGQLAIAAVGVGSVWYGISRMGRASDLREKREDQRHAEAMRALDGQAEALRAVIQGLERQGEALARQGAALEAALKG